MGKKGILDFQKMKRSRDPVTWITAYSYPFAQAAEDGNIDMILVGDSGGMVELGYETTNPVTMDEMITFCKAVRKGAPNTFIVGDMPQGSYEVSECVAVANAMRFVKEAGADSIKLEGGRRVCSQVRAISDAGIIVIGHLGLTPQSTSSFGGYKVQGKTVQSFEETVLDSLALQEAGAQILLLEAMPTEPAAQIAKLLDIPVYGVGAGDDVDGQLVIMHDLMGFYQPFRPWFAKCYIPQVVDEFAEYINGVEDLREHGRHTRTDGIMTLAKLAISHYVIEVKNNIFPGEEYSYPLTEKALNNLKESKYWK